MGYIDDILRMIKTNGMLFTSQLSEAKIPRTYLSILLKNGEIERVSRGVYIAKDMVEDEMYYMQAKVSRIIFSHETALFLHGLSERTPNIYSITVPSTYKIPKDIKQRCKVFYIKPELYDKGITAAETSFGNDIKIYNVERTICDIVRSRSRMDIQIFFDALKKYAKSKNANFQLLNEYARSLKVDKMLREYLGVLL